MGESGKPSVFVSYSHADKEFARKLTKYPESVERKLWIDEAELRVGDSLVSRIAAAIDQARFLAAILSPTSVALDKEELQQALTMQIGGKPLTVLPVLLADCELPGFLRTRLYVDLIQRPL